MSHSDLNCNIGHFGTISSMSATATILKRVSQHSLDSLGCNYAPKITSRDRFRLFANGDITTYTMAAILGGPSTK